MYYNYPSSNRYNEDHRSITRTQKDSSQSGVFFPQIKRSTQITRSQNINSMQKSKLAASQRNFMKEDNQSDMIQVQRPFLMQQSKEVNQKILYPNENKSKKVVQSLNSNYQTQTKFRAQQNKDFVLNHSQGFMNRQNVDLYKHIERMQCFKFKQSMKLENNGYQKQTINTNSVSDYKETSPDQMRETNQLLKNDFQEMLDYEATEIHYLPLKQKEFIITEEINKMTYLEEMANYIQKNFNDVSKLGKFKNVFKDYQSVIQLDHQVLQNTNLEGKLFKEDVYIINVMKQFYNQDQGVNNLNKSLQINQIQNILDILKKRNQKLQDIKHSLQEKLINHQQQQINQSQQVLKTNQSQTNRTNQQSTTQINQSQNITKRSFNQSKITNNISKIQQQTSSCWDTIIKDEKNPNSTKQLEKIDHGKQNVIHNREKRTLDSTFYNDNKQGLKQNFAFYAQMHNKKMIRQIQPMRQDNMLIQNQMYQNQNNSNLSATIGMNDEMQVIIDQDSQQGIDYNSINEQIYQRLNPNIGGSTNTNVSRNYLRQYRNKINKYLNTNSEGSFSDEYIREGKSVRNKKKKVNFQTYDQGFTSQMESDEKFMKQSKIVYKNQINSSSHILDDVENQQLGQMQKQNKKEMRKVRKTRTIKFINEYGEEEEREESYYSYEEVSVTDEDDPEHSSQIMMKNRKRKVTRLRFGQEVEYSLDDDEIEEQRQKEIEEQKQKEIQMEKEEQIKKEQEQIQKKLEQERIEKEEIIRKRERELSQQMLDELSKEGTQKYNDDSDSNSFQDVEGRKRNLKGQRKNRFKNRNDNSDGYSDYDSDEINDDNNNKDRSKGRRTKKDNHGYKDSKGNPISMNNDQLNKKQDELNSDDDNSQIDQKFDNKLYSVQGQKIGLKDRNKDQKLKQTDKNDQYKGKSNKKEILDVLDNLGKQNIDTNTSKTPKYGDKEQQQFDNNKRKGQDSRAGKQMKSKKKGQKTQNTQQSDKDKQKQRESSESSVASEIEQFDPKKDKTRIHYFKRLIRKMINEQKFTQNIETNNCVQMFHIRQQEINQKQREINQIQKDFEFSEDNDGIIDAIVNNLEASQKRELKQNQTLILKLFHQINEFEDLDNKPQEEVEEILKQKAKLQENKYFNIYELFMRKKEFSEQMDALGILKKRIQEVTGKRLAQMVNNKLAGRNKIVNKFYRDMNSLYQNIKKKKQEKNNSQTSSEYSSIKTMSNSQSQDEKDSDELSSISIQDNNKFKHFKLVEQFKEHESKQQKIQFRGHSIIDNEMQQNLVQLKQKDYNDQQQKREYDEMIKTNKKLLKTINQKYK